MIKNKGFTLIELLVVVAILGLLAAIVLFSVDGIKSKSRDTRRVTDIKSIQEGLAMYNNNNQVFPIFDGYITGSDSMSTDLESDGGINGVPADPINDVMGGVTYKYYYQSTQGSDYVIQYYLETDSIQGHPAGLNSVGP
ncbi:MAG: prepilin-type N-terminal cleavage/methylation domain-containing protein [Patescibacteria group bacterium]|nr:prepilin-type N-terminal cleavage/methylation domain-containing protein [Patescibacteria group bacterium]